MKKLRVGIYVRQSHDKAGNETAVERQENDCRKLAEAKGWDGLILYADNDKSATNGKERPRFEDLVRDVESGQVDAIVVWHLDRLTRSIRDLTRIIEAGQSKQINIACVHGVSLDLADPTGVAVATILTAIAAMEVQHKGRRQKAANFQRAQNGTANWTRRPFGYRRQGETVTVDVAEASALQDAADRVLAGETLSSIVRDWNSRGLRTTFYKKDKKTGEIEHGKPWNVTSLRRALLNPRLAGRRLYNGDDMGEGNWQPILAAETHRALEDKLTDPGRRTAPDDLNSKYLLSGICRCGKCGKKMFAAPMKKKDKKWMVYRCFGGYCMTRRMDRVDEVVESSAIGILSSPYASDLIKINTDTTELRRKASDLRDRRDALASMLGEGLLSAAAVREQAGKVTRELTSVELAIEQAEGLDPISALIDTVDVEDRWDQQSLATKRQIIRALMEVTIQPAGKGVRFHEDQVKITPRIHARS